MKSGKTGRFVLYKNVICRLLSMCGDEFIKGGYYISIKDNRLINSKCFEWIGDTIRPITSNEINQIYEISHYVICNGRKYRWFHVKKDINIVQVDADEYKNKDPKYKYVEHNRDMHFLEVPLDEVTLYETKTYYDKDKFINENKRVVLSEETYLIDEPYWLEESGKMKQDLIFRRD